MKVATNDLIIHYAFSYEPAEYFIWDESYVFRMAFPYEDGTDVVLRFVSDDDDYDRDDYTFRLFSSRKVRRRRIAATGDGHTSS